MIFFAVAEPTPGKLSNSFSLAVFKSTFAFVALDFEELFGCRDVWAQETPSLDKLNTNRVTAKQRKALAHDFFIPSSSSAAPHKPISARLTSRVPETLFCLLAKHAAEPGCHRLHFIG